MRGNAIGFNYLQIFLYVRVQEPSRVKKPHQYVNTVDNSVLSRVGNMEMDWLVLAMKGAENFKSTGFAKMQITCGKTMPCAARKNFSPGASLFFPVLNSPGNTLKVSRIDELAHIL